MENNANGDCSNMNFLMSLIIVTWASPRVVNEKQDLMAAKCNKLNESWMGLELILVLIR